MPNQEKKKSIGSRAFIDEERERDRERAGPTNKGPGWGEGVPFVVFFRAGDECRWSALWQVARPCWSFAFLAGRQQRQNDNASEQRDKTALHSLPFPSLPTAHSNLGSLHHSHIQFHSPPAVSNPDFLNFVVSWMEREREAHVRRGEGV